MSQQQSGRGIGLLTATSVVAGSIIGSAIFMKPAVMAAQTSSALWLMAVWLIAGIFTLFGALIYAELGAMFPASGGHYLYFRHMYNDLMGFLYGWAGFIVINTAAVAAIAFVCALYANHFLQLPNWDNNFTTTFSIHLPFIGDLYPLRQLPVKLLAIAIVLVITLLNYVSTRAGGLLQFVSTAVKLLVILLLVGGIFLSGKGETAHFFSSAAEVKSGWQLAGGLIAALTGAFMAYDGWININFMGGEVKHPQQNIPRSLIMGVSICIVTYLLINLAYLYVLPVEKMTGSALVASDAVTAAAGSAGGSVVAAMIVICTFGAVNGNMLATARVTHAMGKDGLFFRFTGRDQQQFRTPGNALLLHAGWTILLILSGSFDMMADMFTFVSWVVYFFGAIGFLRLRKKMPLAERPYRAWGYPWIVYLFIAFSAFYVGGTLWNDVLLYNRGETPVINSLLGLLLTLAGIPVFWYFRKLQSSRK